MFRVFLIPTDEFGKKEMWLNAHGVHETDCGEFWEFLDQDGSVITRLAKAGVKGFEVATDRRKSVRAEISALEEVLSITIDDSSDAVLIAGRETKPSSQQDPAPRAPCPR